MIAFTEKHIWIKGYLLLAVLAISFAVQAQQNRYNWRLGIGVGNQYISGNPYANDSTLSNKAIEFNSNYLAYSAFLELSLSQDFGLKVFTSTRPGDFTLTNSGALLSYYFDNSYLFGSKAFIAPYFNVGLAYGEKANSLNVPFGGGLKFRLNSRININVDYTARTYTDQWGDANFDFGNRLRGYSSVSLHYNFGKKSYSYKAPKPYVSSYPTIQYSRPATEPLIDSIQPKKLDTTNFTKPLDSVAFAFTIQNIDTTTKALPAYGFPIVPQTTNTLKADTLATQKTYQEVRDSTLEELRYQIKKQRLINELNALRKNDTMYAQPVKPDSIVYVRDTVTKDTVVAKPILPLADTTKVNSMVRLADTTKVKPMVALIDTTKPKPTEVRSNIAPAVTPKATADTSTAQTNTTQAQKPAPTPDTQRTNTPQNTQPITTEIRIVDERNNNSNNGTNRRDDAALVAGAATAGALGAKVSNLQNQIDKLEEELARRNAAKDSTELVPASAIIKNDSLADSTVTRPIVKARAPLDTIDITEVELNLVKQRLRLMQQQMDSLMKVKPTPAPVVTPAPAVAPTPTPEKPKTAFETTGKVAVFFDVSSSALSNASKKQLDDMIAFAKARTDVSFLIKGFTDKTGSVEFNRALSLKRAKAVEDYITSKGIEATRLKSVNLGPDQSVGQGSQSFGRRVEVSLN